LQFQTSELQHFTSSVLLKSNTAYWSKNQNQTLTLGYAFSTGLSTIGGGERDRTDDLLLAKQALSQLSYTPDKWWVWMDLNHRPHAYQACALTS
jgi:hypothetical protein